MNRSTDAAAFLKLLHMPGDVREVRAPKCPDRRGGKFKSTAAGFFNDPETAAKAATELDKLEPPGVYVTINPVKPELLARALNRVEHKAEKTTTDADVLSRRWLLIDIDPARPAGVSATESEMQQALDLAKQVRDELCQSDWPLPLFGMSGNGAYLLYRIDLPNDDESRDLVKGVLQGLAERFDTKAATLDTSTFNASRIAKIFGTTARKGDNVIGIEGIEDRPHRVSLFEPPEAELQAVDRVMLLAVAKAPEVKPAIAHSNGQPHNGHSNLARCKAYLTKIDDSIHGEHGSNPCYQAACETVRFGLSESEAWEAMAWYSENKSQPPWSEGEIRHKLQDATKNCAAERGMRLQERLDRRHNPTQQAEKRTTVSASASTASRARELIPHVRFPTEALPPVLATYVSEAAIAIGCDPSYVALPLFACLARAIGNKRTIRLKRGWTEPAIIWAAIVGKSGTHKSPALQAATGILHRKQAEAIAKHTEDAARYEQDSAIYDRDYAQWKRAKSTEPPPWKPPEPACQRFIVGDITVEALADRLAGQFDGVVVVRDELAGWLDGLAEYKGGRGSDTGHWLATWSGAPLTVDRKTGTKTMLHVPRAAVNIVGGIQPGILRRAIGREHMHDGLCARLLLTMPEPRPVRWSEATVSLTTESALERLIDQLLTLEPAADSEGNPAPFALPLSKEAKEVWVAYYDRHRAQIAEVDDDLAAAESKLEAYAARFALIVQLCSWASGEAGGDEIDEMSVTAGVTLADWFGGETKRVYSVIAESEGDSEERELIELIRRKGGTITARDLMRASRRYHTSKEAEAALECLAKVGAGRWEQPPIGDQGGQPARRLRLHDTADADTTPRKHEKNGSSVSVSAVSDQDFDGLNRLFAEEGIGGDEDASFL